VKKGLQFPGKKRGKRGSGRTGGIIRRERGKSSGFEWKIWTILTNAGGNYVRHQAGIYGKKWGNSFHGATAIKLGETRKRWTWG